MTKTQEIVQELCHEADLRALRASMDEDCDQATVAWLLERANVLAEASKALGADTQVKYLRRQLQEMETDRDNWRDERDALKAKLKAERGRFKRLCKHVKSTGALPIFFAMEREMTNVPNVQAFLSACGWGCDYPGQRHDLADNIDPSEAKEALYRLGREGVLDGCYQAALNQAQKLEQELTEICEAAGFCNRPEGQGGYQRISGQELAERIREAFQREGDLLYKASTLGQERDALKARIRLALDFIGEHKLRGQGLWKNVDASMYLGIIQQFLED